MTAPCLMGQRQRWVNACQRPETAVASLSEVARQAVRQCGCAVASSSPAAGSEPFRPLQLPVA